MKRLLVFTILLFASTVIAADYNAEVTGTWVNLPSGMKVSTLSQDYPACQASDAVGRVDKSFELSNPNLGIWLVKCPEITLDALLLDTKYTVLWYEEIAGVPK
jgi:hypothetical protein